jgi:N4-gp56 family major capsid protein
MATGFSAVDVAQKVVAKELIDILRQNLFFYKTAKVQPVTAGSNSKTVIFRGFNKLALASAMSEGVVPTGQNLSLNTVTVTLTQYGDFTRITDVAEFLYDRNLLEDAAEVLGVQATETIENAVVNIIGAGTNAVYGDGSVSTRGTVTAAMVFTTALIRRSVRFLERNNVKKFPAMPVIGRGFVTAGHPDVMNDLRNDTNFINAVNYSSPTPEGRGESTRGDLFSGELGFWLGSRIISTTVAPVYAGAGSAGADIYGVLTYGDGAYGVSELDGGLQTYIHTGGSQDTFNPLEQFATVGWKWMGAAAILDNNRIVRNEVGSSKTGATA